MLRLPICLLVSAPIALIAAPDDPGQAVYEIGRPALHDTANTPIYIFSIEPTPDGVIHESAAHSTGTPGGAPIPEPLTIMGCIAGATALRYYIRRRLLA